MCSYDAFSRNSFRCNTYKNTRVGVESTRFGLIWSLPPEHGSGFKYLLFLLTRPTMIL
jgi:hypothetical protein